MGEHGYDSVHQVYAGPPSEGLQVHGASPLHEMGHVGDVDPDLPELVSFLLDGQGVVVIPGVGRIDGEDVESRPVHPSLPALPLLLRDDGLRRPFHLLRELQIEAVSEQDGKDIHARIRDRADDTLHNPQGIELSAPVAGDPYHHDVPLPGTSFLPVGNQDIPRDPMVEGGNVSQAPRTAVAADDRGMSSFQDLDDPSFGIASLRPGLDTGNDLVTVHGGIQEGGRNPHVLAADRRGSGIRPRSG
jgi:hypothetical protein